MFVLAILLIAVLWLISKDLIRFERGDGQMFIIIETASLKATVHQWYVRCHRWVNSLTGSRSSN